MKSMLMAVMAVAVAVTFSAPAFAGDSPKESGKEGKKPGQAVETIYGDEKKKEEKKGGHADTFGDKKEAEKKAGK